MSRKRADLLLVARGLAESRAKARAAIEAGGVRAAGVIVERPSELIAEDAALEMTPPHPWVSRGGVKLAAALDAFAVEPAGRVCLDVGASTGGFTHVLVARGAARVYAVDVGHGQLHWKLRNDPRVEVRERVNARNLTATEVPEMVDLVVADASFIGLSVVLPAPLARLKPGGRVVALIKPQFEVGPEHVGKGGVVRDPEQHAAVCDRIRVLFETGFRLNVIGLVESPILGPEGNKEFLIGAQLHPGG